MESCFAPGIMIPDHPGTEGLCLVAVYGLASVRVSHRGLGHA